jgi:hypothetical protein
MQISPPNFLGRIFLAEFFIGIVQIIILRRPLPNRAPIGDANRRETRISGKKEGWV